MMDYPSQATSKALKVDLHCALANRRRWLFRRQEINLKSCAMLWKIAGRNTK